VLCRVLRGAASAMSAKHCHQCSAAERLPRTGLDTRSTKLISCTLTSFLLSTANRLWLRYLSINKYSGRHLNVDFFPLSMRCAQSQSTFVWAMQVRNQLTHLEDNVPWNAVKPAWRNRRPGWRRQLKAADSIAEVASRMEEFRQHLANDGSALVVSPSKPVCAQFLAAPLSLDAAARSGCIWGHMHCAKACFLWTSVIYWWLRPLMVHRSQYRPARHAM